MSEYGNETATATLRLGEKAIDALLKLLKFIVDRNERKLNKALRKQQLAKLKSEKNSQELTDYLDKSRGLVKAKMLLNSGNPLIPLKVPMSPNELKRFNSLAKIYGVSFTAIANETVTEELIHIKKELKNIKKTSAADLSEEQVQRQEELERRQAELESTRADKIIVIRKKDLELVKDITDRLNMEILLKDIDKELTELEKKDIAELTEEDKKRIDFLKQRKEEILNGEFDEYNNEKNNSIIQNSIGNPMVENLTFEEAVNRVTDRKYSQCPCFICERTNPDNYMEVSSTVEQHEDHTFTNTEFLVYHQGEKQRCKEFGHGKFTHYSKKDGENSTVYGDTHWVRMKAEMKEKGGFTDDTLIFASKKDYLQYKEAFQKQKTFDKETELSKDTMGIAQQEVQEVEVGEPAEREESKTERSEEKEEYKDYMSEISNLQGELKKMNIAVNIDGQLLKTDTGEVLSAETELDGSLSYAKALNIKEQMDVYKKLNTMQTRLAFALQQQKSIENEYKEMGRPEGSLEMYDKLRSQTHSEMYECNMQISALTGKLNVLTLERDKLNSIEIVDSMQTQVKHKKNLIQKNSKKELRHTKPIKKWEEKVTDKKQHSEAMIDKDMVKDLKPGKGLE